MHRTATPSDASAEIPSSNAMRYLGILDSDNQAIEGKSGFAVRPVGDARVQDLVFDVDWDPSSVEPPAECTNRSDDAGASNVTDVQWTLPVGHANVSLTTQRPFDHPDTPNWLKRVKTCEQDTLALELWGLETAHIRRTPLQDSCKSLTQLWVNTSRARNTDLRTVGFNCEDGSREGKRVKIHPLPTTFWIKTPVDPWHDLKDGAVFTSSERINHFAYIKNECLLIAEDFDPKSSGQQILGLDELLVEGLGNRIGCAGVSAAEGAASATQKGLVRAGGLTASGLDSAGKFILKVSDESKRYVDGVWHDVNGELVERWDVDGHSDQRDQPRFTRLDGEFLSHRLEVRNTQDDRGTVLDLTQFADQGGVSVDAQGQWYEAPQASPSDTLVPGTISVPDSVTEKQCIDWNYTTDPKSCDEYESWAQVQERVAKTYFRQRAQFADGQWETIPWDAWMEAIR